TFRVILFSIHNDEWKSFQSQHQIALREEAKSPVTKNVNSISLTIGEEKKSDKDGVATGDGIDKTNGSDKEMPVNEAETENGAKNRIKTSHSREMIMKKEWRRPALSL
nr:hypothetical protein [Tanacetum cinerariifolium]